MKSTKLTDNQLDALKELVNIGVGQAAGMLNEMIEFRIRLQIPVIKLLTLSELQAELHNRLGHDRLAAVQLSRFGMKNSARFPFVNSVIYSEWQ